ncbi:MAG: hypothetical protein ACWGPN_02715, partial [Gammaproteobacteria bacterium]
MLGFCCRAVVPLGYMPASLADGGPFALCHGASAATLRLLAAVDSMRASGDREADGHVRHDPHDRAPGAAGHSGAGHAEAGSSRAALDHAAAQDTDNGHFDGWSYCPLGAVVSDAAMASAPCPAIA